MAEPRSSRLDRQTRRLAPFLANSLSLNAGKHQSRRASQQADDGLSDDSILSDHSMGEQDGARPSVLDLGSKSYVAGTGAGSDTEPSTQGGGLMEDAGLQFARERQRTQHMLRQQEQFTGTDRANQATPTQTASQFSEQDSGEGQDEEEQEDETNQGTDLIKDKIQDMKQRAIDKAKDKAREAIKKKAQQALQRAAKQTIQSGARLTLEGTDVALSPTLLPIILLILQLNIQMLSKYIFRPLFFRGTFGEGVDKAMDGAPLIDQSFIEDFITICIDIDLCCGAPCCNPACVGFTFIIVIAGVIAERLSDPIKTIIDYVAK